MEIMDKINSVVTEINMVELTDGTKIPVPRLTNSKMLRLIKFVAGDGLIIYTKFTNWRSEHASKTPALDENGVQRKNEDGELLFNFKYPSVEEAVEFFLAELPEEKIAELLAILLGKTTEETIEMDFFDTSLIIAEFLDRTPIEKLTMLVKKIMAKFRPMKQEDLQKAAQPTQPTVTPSTISPLA